MNDVPPKKGQRPVHENPQGIGQHMTNLESNILNSAHRFGQKHFYDKGGAKGLMDAGLLSVFSQLPPSATLRMLQLIGQGQGMLNQARPTAPPSPVGVKRPIKR